MMTASAAGADDDVRLMQLINGFQASQAIYVAVTLGIPDFMRNSSLSNERLASLTGTHPAALYRLLRALAAFGLLHEGADRAFGLTALGRGLVSGPIDSRNAWARFAARPPQWASWGELLHSVRTGETAFRHVHGKDVWSFRASHAEESAIFDLAMRGLSASIASDLAAAYDFTPFGHIIDVGGGNGGLIAGVLAKFPHAKGTLLDLPHVTAGAGEVLEQAGVRERCEIVSGSFFEDVPVGGDVYLLKSIVHDWNDRDALHLLRNCRRAMQSGARLLIIERLLGPPNEGLEGKLSDLNMLVNAGGRERTREEFAALIASAGLTLGAITPLSASRFVIEAIPAGVDVSRLNQDAGALPEQSYPAHWRLARLQRSVSWTRFSDRWRSRC
jgi:hypothetical protein